MNHDIKAIGLPDRLGDESAVGRGLNLFTDFWKHVGMKTRKNRASPVFLYWMISTEKGCREYPVILTIPRVGMSWDNRFPASS